MNNKTAPEISASKQNLITGGDNEKSKNVIFTVLYYAAAPLAIIAAFFILYAICGVYPFSEKHISSYDMNAQIAPIIEHLFDVIDGKSSLFYTRSLAGGMDMFGSLAYCLISPFTFIFLFFGKGHAIYGTSIVLPLKAACICLSALYYLRKRFNFKGVLGVALALCYSASGYFFMANTYINWLDILIWFPFLALGFYNLTQKKGKKLFIAALALTIYSSFSIGCFSLFIIFPIGLCYIYMVAEGDKKALVYDYCSSLAAAIAITLPLLVPAFAAFLSSKRRGGVFDNLIETPSASALYAKFSYIFSDCFTLSLTIAYFVENKVKKNKRSQFLLVALAFIFAPVICDECCKLLNFGSYMSYALRFGFLNSFAFLYCAALYLSGKIDKYKQEIIKRKNDETLAQNSENETEKAPLYVRKRAFHAETAAYCAALFTVVIAAVIGWTLLFSVINDGKYSQHFYGIFAHSLGGLEVIVWFFAAAAVLFIIGMIWGETRELSPKIFAVAACVLLVFQNGFYYYAAVRGNTSNPSTLNWFENAVEYCKNESGEQVRIKTEGDYVSAENPLTMHVSSVTVFSSVTDGANFIASDFFGYSGNGKNVLRSYGGTYLGDCLFGYKYMITNGSHPAGWKEKSGYNAVNDDFTLFENDYAFPLSFKTSGERIGKSSGDKQTDYDVLLSFLGGDKTVSSAVGAGDVITQDDGSVRIRVRAEACSSVYIKCAVPEKYKARYCKYSWREDDALSFDDEKTEKNLNGEAVIRLAGSAVGGQSYSLYVKAFGEEFPLKAEMASWFTVFAVKKESVEKAARLAQSNACETVYSANKTVIKVNANEGDSLFLSFVKLKGHSATINGKKVDFCENFLNLTVLPLENGVNEVVITYNSPYVAYALAGVCAGAVILLVLWLLGRLKDKKQEILHKAVNICALSLGGVVLAVFFVLPVGLGVYNLVHYLLGLLI